MVKRGDKNTTFFHNMIKARRNKSRVESIKDENGKFYEGSNVVEQFVMHFKKFLGEFVPVKSIEDSLFINKINDDNDAVKMIKEVSNEEIKNAIFDIDSNKAFGPDGFSFEFFKKAWGDWKRGLSKIVNINQSAFLPRRHIQDNILIAQELLRGYNRKNWPKRCAMQIDIQKAYDTVDWTFLESTLVKFGFPKKMVKWIMACISSSSFSICLNGNKGSLEVIKKSLDEFSQVSGLNPNLGKSTIFFGSIKEREKQDLLEILPFKCGKLPVRYLGVPLLAKRLSVMDCKVLIDKVEERINCWRNKTLSYAGRVQLLASVLSSMQIYWASLYFLPNVVINDLDKLFKRFLWNSGNSAQGKARVAWKMVCRPKDQGGLGIKPLKQWNEDIDMEKSDSWGWKTMLKTRDAVKSRVWHSIGNGERTSMFYDKWCSNGPLSKFISKRNLYDSRISDNVVVAEMLADNEWKWPSDWLSKFTVLNSIIPPNIQKEKEDLVMWVNNKDQKVKFSTNQAWLTMRDEWPKVQCVDSHEHLFFKCDFALQVWKEILNKFNKLGGRVILKDIVEVISNERSKNSIGMVVNKLILAATVYTLWQERNQRIFRDEFRNVEAVCKTIYEQVKSKLMTLKVKKSINVIKEASKWDLQWNNMSVIAI
ncbi:probable L-cysteine desulfhydrase, chloroplastic [Tanacetum coccineum]|uniref:Probable L-cysteine desulfhydrase, chloroplastic n=1 Tax=Tanacetum coccineum TaxID=301880 RepID=A0ABQ5IXP8_9ASTR